MLLMLAHITISELGVAAGLFLAGAVCGVACLWHVLRLQRER